MRSTSTSPARTATCIAPPVRYEVLVASAERWALMHEHRGAAEPPLDELLGHLSPCDLVLVEGFKSGTHPKLEVYRARCGQAPLARDDAIDRRQAIDD